MKKGEKIDPHTHKLATQCFAALLLTWALEHKRTRGANGNVPTKRLRCEKNNLILKVDLFLWQQQISFSPLLSLFKKRTRKREGELERIASDFSIFRVKFTTICIARYSCTSIWQIIIMHAIRIMCTPLFGVFLPSFSGRKAFRFKMFSRKTEVYKIEQQNTDGIKWRKTVIRTLHRNKQE